MIKVIVTQLDNLSLKLVNKVPDFLKKRIVVCVENTVDKRGGQATQLFICLFARWCFLTIGQLD